MGDYAFEPKDRLENFHGNQVVYVHWEDHLSFCAPLAFPLPPEMPFGALLSEVLPGIYGKHPDWARVDWGKATWTLDGAPFSPEPEAELRAQGIGHKSVLRFVTPGLKGWEGTSS
jgi:phenol hydroxylase P4 protein